MTRTVTSRMGARTPTEEYVGRQPISTVAKPMTSSDAISTGRRPILSPR